MLPHERTTPKAKSRPARSPPGDARQPLGGLGSLPRPRAVDADRADRATPRRRLHGRRRRPPRGVAGRRPDRLRRHRRRGGQPRRSSSPTVITATRRASPTATRSAPTSPAPTPRCCYVVELAPEQLTVRPIHRLLSGLPAGFDFLAALDAAYVVEPSTAPPSRPATEPSSPPPERLDSRPATTTARPRHRATRAGARRAAGPRRRLPARRRRGRRRPSAPARPTPACCCRRVTVDEIAGVADARDRMPPKTTFFWPKPRTGIVFRSLER